MSTWLDEAQASLSLALSRLDGGDSESGRLMLERWADRDMRFVSLYAAIAQAEALERLSKTTEQIAAALKIIAAQGGER